MERFGWRRIDFLLATESGKTLTMAKALLACPEVIYAGRSIGQHTIDLTVETIMKNNADILDMMVLLKALPGVKDAMWTEIVEVLGAKSSVPAQIIDKL